MPPTDRLPQDAAEGASSEGGAEKALVPQVRAPEEGEVISPSNPVARLPVEMDVAIPVREFRVRNLLTLRPGEVIETQWVNGEDIPLAAGDVKVAWTEFEVLESQLAVRITRLA